MVAEVQGEMSMERLCLTTDDERISLSTTTERASSSVPGSKYHSDSREASPRPFQELLSDELIREVLVFLGDPQSLVRVASTCQNLRRIVLDQRQSKQSSMDATATSISDVLWSNLYRQRWGEIVASSNEDSPPVIPLQEYKTRHCRERQVVDWLRVTTKKAKPRQEIVFPFTYPCAGFFTLRYYYNLLEAIVFSSLDQGAEDDDDDNESGDDEVEEQHSGTDMENSSAVDHCADHDSFFRYPVTLRSPLTSRQRCAAADLFSISHFHKVAHEWSQMLKDRSLSDDEKLEEGLCLLSASLWTASDGLLPSGPVGEGANRTNKLTSPADKRQAIKAQLDDLAHQLETRVRVARHEEEGITGNRPARGQTTVPNVNHNITRSSDPVETMAAVKHLNTLLFLQMGFTGNTSDYYNVANSSIEEVMKKRTGIPLTLAVLYKCILRRIGITVHVIGLPGHVVLGMNDDTYCDVYRGGVPLSVDDCRLIAGLYGIPWMPSYLRPLTHTQVLGRMLRNMLNCYTRSFGESVKIKNIFGVERTRTLMYLLEQHESPRRPPSYQPRTKHIVLLDPETFEYYGVDTSPGLCFLDD